MNLGPDEEMLVSPCQSDAVSKPWVDDHYLRLGLPTEKNNGRLVVVLGQSNLDILSDPRPTRVKMLFYRQSNVVIRTHGALRVEPSASCPIVA